jgi:drug/metabolite transporter (DMT)-like permease
LSTATLTPEPRPVDHKKSRQAILVIVACTFISTAAQVLIKLGADQLGHTGMLATLMGIFTIPLLFAGYCLYGLFTVLMVYALREGELSILYPIIALGYVWVTIVMVMFFHETMNPLKAIGVAIIVAGVAVLGFGSKR